MFERSRVFLRPVIKAKIVTSNQPPERESSSSANITIEKPYKLHQLDVGPEVKVSLSRDDALNYYKNMFTIRRSEQKAAELYKAREIRGFCHLYSGQEAGAVGMKAAMRDTDSIITSYRCHAWVYLQGGSTQGLLAELMGRRTGHSKGKGGSMHMYANNFYGGNGIVGAQVPLGVGSAFAHKYRGTKGVCFVLYGDGAANQGQIAEAFNLAKLLHLPAVFVCENNKYGMGTSTIRAAASPEFYKRAPYLPGLWVNGMDVLAVREAARFAIAHILAGKGPILVEHETYRYFGHSMSDPGTSYRTREEVQKVRASRDPISKFKEILLKEKLVTAEELKNLEKDCNKMVNEAETKAKKDPFPPMGDLGADIYAKPLAKEIRGISPYDKVLHLNTGKSIS